MIEIVRTREGDHVLLGESLRGEEWGQVGEARRRRRDVVVGAAEARRCRVPPPNLDVPARPAQLHIYVGLQVRFHFDFFKWGVTTGLRWRRYPWRRWRGCRRRRQRRGRHCRRRTWWRRSPRSPSRSRCWASPSSRPGSWPCRPAATTRRNPTELMKISIKNI